MSVPALLVAEDDTPRAFAGTRFTVPGIKCAGCIGKIERELPKNDGIESARVNFSAKRVAIEQSYTAFNDPSLFHALDPAPARRGRKAHTIGNIRDRQRGVFLNLVENLGFNSF